MFGSEPSVSHLSKLLCPQALANSTLEYENLESEVSALHDDLWEQLNLDNQNEALSRQIQKEIWRIQDAMEGLRKNNPSRGTDTAKHRGRDMAGPVGQRFCVLASHWVLLPHTCLSLSSPGALGPSASYGSNSPASPLSSASLTSPLSPFSLMSGSQGSPTKPGSSEVSREYRAEGRWAGSSLSHSPGLQSWSTALGVVAFISPNSPLL